MFKELALLYEAYELGSLAYQVLRTFWTGWFVDVMFAPKVVLAVALLHTLSSLEWHGIPKTLVTGGLASLQTIGYDPPLYGRASAVLLALCLSVAAILVFPVVELPGLPKDGQWETGEDKIDVRADGRGSIKAVVFYPVEKHRHTGGGVSKWMSSTMTWASVLNHSGVPAWCLGHLKTVKTHAYMMAPVSKKRNRYPIVFLSHALGLGRSAYTSMSQSLACLGYIVVVLEHPSDLLHPPPGVSKDQVEDTSEFSNLMASIPSTPISSSRSSPRKQGRTTERGSFPSGVSLLPTGNRLPADVTRDLKFRNEQLKKRVRDLQMTYNAMQQIGDERGWLQAKIDWSACYLIGHGFGAATAVIAASRNTRFHGCVLLSPWFDPINEADLSDEKSTTHFMVLSTASPSPDRKVNNRVKFFRTLEQSSGDRVLLRLSRCTWLDQTDIPLAVPYIFRMRGLSGPRHPEKTLQMTTRIVANFLSRQYRQSLFGVPKWSRRVPVESDVSDSNEGRQAISDGSGVFGPVKLSKSKIDQCFRLLGIPIGPSISLGRARPHTFGERLDLLEGAVSLGDSTDLQQEVKGDSVASVVSI